MVRGTHGWVHDSHYWKIQVINKKKLCFTNVGIGLATNRATTENIGDSIQDYLEDIGIWVLTSTLFNHRIPGLSKVNYAPRFASERETLIGILSDMDVGTLADFQNHQFWRGICVWRQTGSLCIMHKRRILEFTNG